MSKVTILGAGSWGTAIAILLSNNGHQVSLWSALPQEVKLLQETRAHEDRLPGAHLADSCLVSGSLEEVLTDPDLTVFAVASPYVRATAKLAAPYFHPGQIVVNVAKGIEEQSLSTLSEVLEAELPEKTEVAVLSGPSHAEEVSKGIPTTCVVGARSKSTAKFIQDIFMNEKNFRVYTSPDIVGIELGGSLKNVIALAAGIVDGLGYGDNTKAALMTRGIAEMSRLGIAMGGNPVTFSGLSGVGDLIVTCTSVHSRNRMAGYYMGQGLSMQEAMDKVNQVVEGVYSAKAASMLAKKYHVSMPIIDEMNAILFQGLKPAEALSNLIQRDKRSEYSSLEWERE